MREVLTCFISAPAACEGMRCRWDANEVLWRWGRCCKASPCLCALPDSLRWAVGEVMAGPFGHAGGPCLWFWDATLVLDTVPRVGTVVETGQLQDSCRAGLAPLPSPWLGHLPCQTSGVRQAGVPRNGCRVNRAHLQPRSPSHPPDCDTWQPRAFWSHSAPRTWISVLHQGGLQLDGTSHDNTPHLCCQPAHFT